MPLALPASQIRTGLSRWDGIFAWAAWLIPLCQGIGAIPGSPTWQGDLGILRDLGLTTTGSEGAVSTLLVQLLAALPVGGRWFRASLVGVIALAIGARLLFGLLRDLLDSRAPLRVNALFALIGSQIWALSPLALETAAIPGSALVAVALCLSALARLAPAARGVDARALPIALVFAGLTLGEDHGVGLGLLALGSFCWWVTGRRTSLAMVTMSMFAAFAAAASCLLVRWLPGVSNSHGLDLGLGFSDAREAGVEVAVTGALDLARRTLAGWFEQLGVVGSLIGIAGLAFGLARPLARQATAFWCALALLGAIGPFAAWAGSERAASSVVLLSSIGVVAGLCSCLQAVTRALWFERLPLGRPASILCAAFALTLLLHQLDRPLPLALGANGAELWSDEALGKLPPQSLVLVQTRTLALRLLAARVLHDDRPDVLIVPMPFLASGHFAEALQAQEPAISPLLRQLAANGFSDEYSLCRLADERPSFVELDGHWDRRLREHLRPAALWLSFSAHPLGSADRRSGVKLSRAALRRIAGALPESEPFDPRTMSVITAQLAQQAELLAGLGDGASSERLLRSTARLGSPLDRRDPARPLAADVELGRPAVLSLR